MNWEQVERELLDDRLVASPLTIDTLHGSMWALGHRLLSFEDAMEKDGDRIVSQSLKRVRELRKDSDFTFRPRVPERCGLGIGTYGWKYRDDVILEAIERGAVLIDTAEGYGYGRVEGALGEILKRRTTPSIDVATKVRRDHMSPRSIRNAALRSKEKLGLVPHYQLHFPNVQYPLSIRVLADLRREGLIKSIGLSNHSVDMIESAQRFLSDYSGDVIRSVQARYSLFDQRIAGALLPYCQERGIVVIAYCPLGQGNLKVKPELRRIAKTKGATPAQIVLAWLLNQPGVLPIPRTNSIEHLRENLDAREIELSPEDVEYLGLVYSR